MKHEASLSKLWLWQLMMQHKQKAFNSMFWLALMINAALVVRSSMCIDQQGKPLAWSDRFCSTDAQDVVMWWGEANETWPLNASNGIFSFSGDAGDLEYPSIVLQIIIFTFGVLMALSSVMIFLLHALKGGLPRIRRGWRQRTGRNGAFEELTKRARHSLAYALYFYSRNALDFILEAQLLYYAFTFSCVVAGLIWSPIFFCVGLLDLFRMDPSLRDVAVALGSNARPIMFTFLFVLVIIYIYFYALLGY
eukprot:4202874-Prymnesium_polylepis.1